MGDMKDKMKGFMKKVNNPFASSSSSSSSKFKGQGRVLGSSSSGPTNPIPNRPPSTTLNSKPAPSVISSYNPRPSQPPQKPSLPDQTKPLSSADKNANRKPPPPPPNGFDPYDSLITSGKRTQHGYSLNEFECPICNRPFRSEDEVSQHVDSCVGNKNNDSLIQGGNNKFDVEPSVSEVEVRSELENCVNAFVSAKPPESSVDVVLRLLRNIVREPENTKFRKIRISNKKIREAIGEVAGGLELLECIGFSLKDEGGEMWAEMEVPGAEQLHLINNAVALLEPKKIEEGKKMENTATTASSEVGEPVEPKKIDRQIRVFFAVPESLAAKIELPDSFYNLSLEEVKREAEMRKKKMAESQLLIPKSYKEKQAKASRKKYTRSMIRVQFPDGVVLQGVFAPWERTGALYEFVSMALKEPSLEFELLDPVLVKRRVIPHSPAPGERATTLGDEGLVPSALIKFRPIETDSIVFTGLCNELLEISEPLQ